MKYPRRPLSSKAQQALEGALDQLMETQVCDAALDGSSDCEREPACVFHRSYRPARRTRARAHPPGPAPDTGSRS